MVSAVISVRGALSAARRGINRGEPYVFAPRELFADTLIRVDVMGKAPCMQKSMHGAFVVADIVEFRIHGIVGMAPFSGARITQALGANS